MLVLLLLLPLLRLLLALKQALLCVFVCTFLYDHVRVCIYAWYKPHKCPLSTTTNKSLFVRNILEAVDLCMGLAVP